MKEFILITILVTVCTIMIAQNLPAQNIHHKNIEQKISTDSFEYEFINKSTRFNRKTGNVEYFLFYDECLKIGSEPIYGRWINSKNVSMQSVPTE